MLNLTTGTYADLERAFLGDFHAASAENPLSSRLVLSPSRRLLDHLQRQSLKPTPGVKPANGYLNTHFLTFYALAERLVADTDISETIVTEPAFYQEVVWNVLTSRHPEPVDLEIRKALGIGQATIARGLAGALAETLKDMRDAGLQATSALRAAQEGFLGAEAPEAAATLALYARLVGLFERKQLRTSADLLRRAAARAPTHPWIQQQSAIFLYGFYDLTGVQLDLVLSLAQHPNVRLYFPFDAGNSSYAYAEKLLKDPAFVSKCRIGGKDGSEDRRVLGGIADPALPPTRPTEVWSCSGARDEVWLAAKEILRLADEGTPFEAIAVVARQLTPYLPALRDIFRDHQIPFVASRQAPAGSHPLIKSVRTLLTLDDRNPHAKTLRKDLDKSPYIRLPEPSVASPAGKGGIEAQDEPKPWSVHLDWTRNQMAHRIQLPDNASAEEITLLALVTEAIDALEVLDRLGEPVTREHFLSTLDDKLQQLERPVTAPRHVGVQVLEVQDARGLSFKTVFLLGMNEKVFPRLIREDAFLSDAARSALSQATGSRLLRKMDGYDEERLLFALMEEAATQSFYLLTQRSDEEGKALIPSVYLKELSRRRPDVHSFRLSRGFVEKFEGRDPRSWTPREASFLMNRSHLSPEPLYRSLRWPLPSYDRLRQTQAALESFQPGIGPHDGRLEDLQPLKGTLEKPFSPSSLEDLAECPFQYFAGHVLKIRPPEELAPEGQLTPQGMGTLFHKTLEHFYTSGRDHGIPTTPEGIEGGLRTALKATLEEFKDALSTAYPLLMKSIEQVLFKELSVFIKSEFEELRASGFTPRWLEERVCGQLPTAGLPYRFLGKPDRIDLRIVGDQAQVRVVDYKSGKPRPGTGKIETEICRGRFLQLPIYLGLAGPFATEQLGKTATATEAVLRAVRSPLEEDTQKSLAGAFWLGPSAPIFTENIRELIKLIEDGRFYIEPSAGEWGYCTRCPFAAVCRKEHMPTRWRAAHDARRVLVSDKLSRTAPKEKPAATPRASKRKTP